MTRFILVTFAFLAWSFWYLSGGAEYEPRVASAPIFAPAVPMAERDRGSNGADLLDRADLPPPLTTTSARPQATQTPARLPSDPEADVAPPDASPDAPPDAPSVATGSPASTGADGIAAAAERLVREALADEGATQGEIGRALDRVLADPALDGIGAEGLAAGLGETVTGSLSATLRDGDRAAEVEAAVRDALSGVPSDAAVVTGALTGQPLGPRPGPPGPSGQPDQPAAAGPAVAPALPAPAAPNGADRREVLGDLVNMRAGPGTGFEVLARLSEGAAVEVLEEAGDGWLRLRVVATGETGFIADWLVSEAR